MSPRAESEAQVLEAIREALRQLRYGTVVIVVHDGEVVQLERTEKTRLVAGRIPGPASG